MAFGGLGAAASLVQRTSLNPRGQYVETSHNGQPTNSGNPNATNIFWQKTDIRAATNQVNMNNRSLLADRATLQRLIVQAIPAGALLGVAGFIGGDGSSASVGILSTAAVGVAGGVADPSSIHFLPANFGRGRGRWFESDFPNLRTRVVSLDTAQQLAAGQTSLPEVVAVEFVDTDGDGLGDWQLTYFNRGLVAVPTGSWVEIDFLHSIDR